MKFEIEVHQGDVDADLIEYVEWLQKYRGYHSFALAFEEVLRAGKSRVEQLRRYNEKRRDPSSTFRPYAPLKLSETERGNAKRAAIAEGVATVRDSRAGQCDARNGRGRRCLLPAGHFAEDPDDHEF
jgi:hypothetical protein